MKAKIEVAIGMVTAVLCAIGIIITTLEYASILDGIAVGASVLVLLLGLYITSLLLKKQRMVWIVISAWFAIWMITFLMGVLRIGGDVFPEISSLVVWVVAWTYDVLSNFFGGPSSMEFFRTIFGWICGNLLVTSLLSVGALGLKQSKESEVIV